MTERQAGFPLIPTEQLPPHRIEGFFPAPVLEYMALWQKIPERGSQKSSVAAALFCLISNDRKIIAIL
jgi:hypothetical protein